MCQDDWNKSGIAVLARNAVLTLRVFSSHKVKQFYVKSISVSPGCLFLGLKHFTRTRSLADVTGVRLQPRQRENREAVSDSGHKRAAGLSTVLKIIKT